MPKKKTQSKLKFTVLRKLDWGTLQLNGKALEINVKEEEHINCGNVLQQ